MKNKKVIRTLISIVPLASIIAPLTGCSTIATNVHKNISMSHSDSTWKECLVKISRTDEMIIGTNDKLLIPPKGESTDEDQIMDIICEDTSFTISDIATIELYTSTGHWELGKNVFYSVQFDDLGRLQVVFKKDLINGLSTLDDVQYVRINPVGITKYERKVKLDSAYATLKDDSPYYPCKEKEVEIELSEALGYKFNGQVTASIGSVEIEDIQKEEVEDYKLKIKVPAVSYDKIDKNAALIIAPIVVPVEDPSLSAIFAIETAPSEESFAQYSFYTQPNCIEEGASSFQLDVKLEDLYTHGKKIVSAEWYLSDETYNPFPCEVTVGSAPGEYIFSGSHTQPGGFASDISINLHIAPIEDDKGTFENDDWESLKYWIAFGKGASRDIKDQKLAKIYGLNSLDDFIGKKRKVVWDSREHDVMVVSTHSLPIVKESGLGSTILDEEDIDFDNRALFTFQFTNLITDSKGNVVKKIFTKDNYFFQDNDNRNGWEYWDEDHIDHHSSQIRQYFRDGKKGHFQYSLDDTVREMVVHTATPHFTRRSTQSGYQEYINDAFFIPTAQQLNAKRGEFIPFENKEASQTFKYYADKFESTNDNNDYRMFWKAGGDSADAQEYWLASPTDAHTKGEPQYDAYGTLTGAFKQGWMTKKRALIPCFSIDEYYW